MKKSPNVQLKLLTHFSKEQFQNPLPYTIAPTTLNFLPTDLPTYWCDVMLGNNSEFFDPEN